MTVYTGEISHKKNLGRTRTVTATNNSDFARAFGVSGTLGQSYSNGKEGMLQLEGLNGHSEIAVDPNEMTRVKDLSYVNSHVADIVDFSSLTTALLVNHRSEIQNMLIRLAPLSNQTVDTVSNTVRGILIKNMLGVASKKELQDALDSDAQNPSDVLKDMLSRSSFQIKAQQNHETGGVTFSITVQGTSAIKITPKSIQLRLKMTTNVAGSAGSTKGVYRDNFKEIKKEIIQTETDFSATDDAFKMIRFDPYEKPENIVAQAMDKYREIARKLVNQYIKKIDNKFAHIENFNPASSKSSLWEALHLSSDVSSTGVSDTVLRQFHDNNVSAITIANDPTNKIVINVQKATIKRLDGISVSDFVEQLTEQLGIKNPTVEQFNTIEKTLFETIDGLKEDVSNTTNYQEAYVQYGLPNQQWMNKIIRSTISNLDNTFKDIMEDKIKDEITSSKNKIEVFMYRRMIDFVEKYYENKGIFIEKPLLSKIVSDMTDMWIDKAINNDYTGDMPIIDQMYKYALDTENDYFNKAIDKANEIIENTDANTVDYSKLSNDVIKNLIDTELKNNKSEYLFIDQSENNAEITLTAKEYVGDQLSQTMINLKSEQPELSHVALIEKAVSVSNVKNLVKSAITSLNNKESMLTIPNIKNAIYQIADTAVENSDIPAEYRQFVSEELKARLDERVNLEDVLSNRDFVHTAYQKIADMAFKKYGEVTFEELRAEHTTFNNNLSEDTLRQFTKKVITQRYKKSTLQKQNTLYPFVTDTDIQDMLEEAIATYVSNSDYTNLAQGIVSDYGLARANELSADDVTMIVYNKLEKNDIDVYIDDQFKLVNEKNDPVESVKDNLTEILTDETAFIDNELEKSSAYEFAKQVVSEKFREKDLVEIWKSGKYDHIDSVQLANDLYEEKAKDVYYIRLKELITENTKTDYQTIEKDLKKAYKPMVKKALDSAKLDLFGQNLGANARKLLDQATKQSDEDIVERVLEMDITDEDVSEILNDGTKPSEYVSEYLSSDTAYETLTGEIFDNSMCISIKEEAIQLLNHMGNENPLYANVDSAWLINSLNQLDLPILLNGLDDFDKFMNNQFPSYEDHIPEDFKK